jgi:hypothetical protein
MIPRRKGTMKIAQVPSIQSTQILSPSTKRVGLIFSPGIQNGSGTVVEYQVKNGPMSSFTDGMVVTTVGPLYLNIEQHGDIVQHEWFAFTPATNCAIAVIEVFEP